MVVSLPVAAKSDSQFIESDAGITGRAGRYYLGVKPNQVGQAELIQKLLANVPASLHEDRSILRTKIRALDISRAERWREFRQWTTVVQKFGVGIFPSSKFFA